MKIFINGEEKEIKTNYTVNDLVEDIKNTLPKMFVIELNGEVIYKENYEITRLVENDKVKIVAFAGGD